MLELNFSVDDKLCLVSCSGALAELLGLPGQAPLGAPYHKWLRPIRCGSEDAVAMVVRLGKPLRLAGHPFVCRHGSCAVDIVIESLAAGALVNIDTHEACRPLTGGRCAQRWSGMDKVAAMLSHGVRNPLNAIKGAVTYLQGRYAHEAELGEFADIIVEEISRLEQFISGFLSTSRQDSIPEPVEINGLLKKIVAYTSLQAQAAGVAVALECAVVPPLRIDAFQLEQAVLNLFNNALAVLPEGGEILLASRVEQWDGRSFVVVEVADNGPGMPRAKIEALQDPASEPEPGRDRGFGLFITREVVAAYGGRLEIVSAASQGTRVRLLLPVPADHPAGQASS